MLPVLSIISLKRALLIIFVAAKEPRSSRFWPLSRFALDPCFVHSLRSQRRDSRKPRNSESYVARSCVFVHRRL